MVKFCIDQIIDGKPYPNLARLDAKPYTQEWRKFSTTWPFSEPVHFIEYLDRCGIEYQFVEWTQADRHTLYPISISYFDFGVDWFSIMPTIIREKLRSKSLTAWFFYSEGDNPQHIRDRLDQLCLQHEIDPRMIQVTTANSAATSVSGFTHFVDDECLFWLRNTDAPIDFHDRPRKKKFTALVRTGKWWRAAVMASIWKNKWNEQGYFSYNDKLHTGEHWRECPIPLIKFPGLYDTINQFLSLCPFAADDLDSDTHNLYSTTVIDHFENSYLNIILETHYDADRSGGVFLTEKTFKPIKNSQPFIIFGPAGSIAQLKSMGYRTFDHVIDHRYDSITDNTQRWMVALEEVRRLMSLDLHDLYIKCREDLSWNQQLFLDTKSQRLNTLLNKISDNAKYRKQLY